jgi:regulator of sigma E protease
MTNLFGEIWWLIVTLGILVTFHEFGHFWVARRLGVKVLRFSVGFGRPLWKRIGKDGTEYVIAAIPLGGYVKFLDSRETELAGEEIAQDFNRKPVWKRAAITIAGPAANLVFTVFALWAMFVIGKPDYLPVVGQPKGLAAEAGFVAGDRLVKVGDTSVGTWTDATLTLVMAAIDRKPLDIAVVDPAGVAQTRRLDFSRIEAGKDEAAALRAVGLPPRQFQLPLIGTVTAGSPAEQAGLKLRDRIVSINGKPVADWDGMVQTIGTEAAAGSALTIAVQRGSETLTLAVQPRQETDPKTGAKSWKIGIGGGANANYDTVLRYGPLDAVGAAFAETGKLTSQTLGMLKNILIGAASLKNLSGVISIAEFARVSAEEGFAWFLSFLALISLSLCIMNLLPIPILDGGHLVYYLIESIKGSPVSERALIAGQYAGLVLLAALMGLALFNDVMRRIPF